MVFIHFRAVLFVICFFFFNDTATTEIYTLSLHDALPISPLDAYHGTGKLLREVFAPWGLETTFVDLTDAATVERALRPETDRKSTRLNSSHANISYAVFCLKKKKKIHNTTNVITVPNSSR